MDVGAEFIVKMMKSRHMYVNYVDYVDAHPFWNHKADRSKTEIHQTTEQTESILVRCAVETYRETVCFKRAYGHVRDQM